MPYQSSGEEVRKGDVVCWRWEGKPYEGATVRMTRDGSWVDVRYSTGPSSIFPEIDHRTRRLPAHRLDLVHRAGE